MKELSDLRPVCAYRNCVFFFENMVLGDVPSDHDDVIVFKRVVVHYLIGQVIIVVKILGGDEKAAGHGGRVSVIIFLSLYFPRLVFHDCVSFLIVIREQGSRLTWFAHARAIQLPEVLHDRFVVDFVFRPNGEGVPGAVGKVGIA